MLQSAWLPFALVIGIFTADWLLFAYHNGVIGSGLLDEPAHLATAVLLLLAVVGYRTLRANPWFAGAAVLMSSGIDLDHAPMYLGLTGMSVNGRPFTHSIATVLVLGALCAGWWIAARRTARTSAAVGTRDHVGRDLAGGMTVGVLLHFVRDVATGPGLPLVWPLSTQSILLPFELYAGVVVAAAVAASWRALHRAHADRLDPEVRVRVHPRV